MRVIARVNQLELRLVRSGRELDSAQALRFRVFYEEMGASPSDAMFVARRDFDAFDDKADHLVVVDLDRSTKRFPHVVGCYRMLRESAAGGAAGLYTAGEFDLGSVRSPWGELMELGRSCVDAEYRTGLVMQLLWRGILDYLDTYRIGLMLGCASLPGTEPDAIAPLLSYLHHHHLAAADLRPRALPDRYVRADLVPAEALDARSCLRQLPPLLKAYLRMGGTVGEGAVVDEQFNTIDVCLVLPTDRVKAHYMRHYRQHRPQIAAAA